MEVIDEKRCEDFKKFRKSGISQDTEEVLIKAIRNEKVKCNTHSYSCNNTKIIVDENGYILKANGLLGTMWGVSNIDELIVGKHIIELAKMLKEYSAFEDEGMYISFLENVVLDFYEKKEQLEKSKVLRK